MATNWKGVLGCAAFGGGLFLVGRALARSSRRYDFRGRTVLITGGSRGLGLVLARALADEGARLVLCARSGEELDRAANELRERGASVLTHVCDVTDRDQAVNLIRRLEDQNVRIDVLVNNAGIIQAGPMESMTREDYDEAMRTHFYGPMTLIEAVLPQMRRRGEGRIVNIASIGGVISVPHLLPYSASKFALVGYSLGLRSELRKDGILVSTICPGLMRTGSPRNAWFKGQHRAEYAWFKIGDSLPILSISAERAAHKIVEACRYGDAFAILGTPMKVAATLYSLVPGIASDALALVNRFLPGPGGIGAARARGYESESAWSESFLTAATQRAAVRNNEMSDGRSG